MEESKLKTKTQFKLLDLVERETEKINKTRNKTSEIERHLNQGKTGNDTTYEIQSAGIYGFQ